MPTLLRRESTARGKAYMSSLSLEALKIFSSKTCNSSQRQRRFLEARFIYVVPYRPCCDAEQRNRVRFFLNQLH